MWPLVHIEHSLNSDETAENVDERDDGGDCRQRFDDVGRVVTAAHQVQSADSCDAGDGDVHGHQRGTESWGGKNYKTLLYVAVS